MTLANLILAAAKAAKISGPLLLAICVQESNLDPKAMLPVDGHTPTYGVCQIKLETARMIGFKGNAITLMKPEVNAKWAANYLKYQLDRYDGDECRAVSAYNAGSYSESKVAPGKPRNLKYVLNVEKKLSRGSLKCESSTANEIASVGSK